MNRYSCFTCNFSFLIYFLFHKAVIQSIPLTKTVWTWQDSVTKSSGNFLFFNFLKKTTLHNFSLKESIDLAIYIKKILDIMVTAHVTSCLTSISTIHFA